MARPGTLARLGALSIGPPRHDAGPSDFFDSGPEPHDGGGPPGLSGHLLALDHAIRLFIIGLAAWLGARWLSQPMRKLVQASQSLGGSLGAQQQPAPLDEARGTLEVREAARVFNTLAQRLRAHLSARSLMVAAISHDLRTPMTRNRMRLEQWSDDPLSRRSMTSRHHDPRRGLSVRS